MLLLGCKGLALSLAQACGQSTFATVGTIRQPNLSGGLPV